ncbi:MAG: FAD-dependent oxidoreductase [Deltaproteobacteria bacterium]|nr:FAD-dependent oxidoreductase [Deltaproteobacteria bacterium]
METQKITLFINGKTIEVPEGCTVLDAAARAGVRIPTLCNDGRLAPAEACRFCQVEIEGNERPVTACSTKASQNLSVTTESPTLMRDRKTILSLLLEDHYGDCFPPCSERCPANIDIQGYLALVARGQYLEACRLIRRTNPLPLTCGRVCPHPCEAQCRRGRVDEPININHIKRFASDIAYRTPELLNPPRAPLTNKRVAVIGGGPAGLTASYFLAMYGHSPVVFESMPRLGGMLRYGIPEYRLPKAVLDREIDAVLRMGVEVRTGVSWPKDLTLEGLIHQGFDAVFLALGAWTNHRLAVENEHLSGVFPGTIFLNEVATGRKTDIGRRVAVIGGGNTAMDCARTSLRLGAATVTVYYRRSRNEMPAQDIEVEEAMREGVRMEFLTAPEKILGDNGQVTGMEFVRMELVDAGPSSRPRPRPIPGSEEQVALDTIIVAIGQTPESHLFGEDSGTRALSLDKRGLVQVDSLTGQTSIENVFAAGDLTSGPATAVEAIGSGRRAAEAIDRFLRGLPLTPPAPFLFSKGILKEVDEANFAQREKIPREKMPELPVEDREGNFREIELGLTEEQARTEANRCLSCGCMAFADCRIRDVAHLLGETKKLVQIKPTQPYRILSDHPHIVIDDNKCVVCRLCERACATYHGRYAVTVELEPVGQLEVYRSHRTRINRQCNDCGLCVSVCPTGALTYKTLWSKRGPFPEEKADTVCNLCSLGCGLSVACIGEHTLSIDSPDRPPNVGHLCERGRFELLSLRDGDRRITRPLVRRNGRLEEAGWDEAFDAIAGKIGELKQSAGSNALAGLTFGRGTLEELYLFAKLVRIGLFTDRLDMVGPGMERPFSRKFLSGVTPQPFMPPYDEIEKQDVVILFGPAPENDLRLLEPALHRLIQNGGKLMLAGRENGPFPEFSDQADVRKLPGGLAAVLEAIGETGASDAIHTNSSERKSMMCLVSEAGLTEQDVEPLKRLNELMRNRRGMWGLIPAAPNGAALWKAPLSLVYPCGDDKRERKNRCTLRDLWARDLPEVGSGSADRILAELEAGRIKGLVLHSGLNPEKERISNRLSGALNHLDFLVLLTFCHEPLVEHAHVVLPRCLCLESEGAFVRGDSQTIRCSPAAAPPAGLLPDWRVLGEILQRMDGPAPFETLAKVQEEMSVLERETGGGAHG